MRRSRRDRTLRAALAACASFPLWASVPARAQRVTLAAPQSWDAARLADAPDPAPLLGLRSAGDPELDYVLNCRGCHRPDGGGTPGAVPALAGSMAAFLGVDGGREYLVRVPGVAHSALDDVAMAALLNWMLARFDPGNLPPDFRPYTAAEIAPLRRRPLIRAGERRAALLESLAASR